MQQASINHLQKIVDLIREGNYADLEAYIRENKVPEDYFSQALIESLKEIRDTQEHLQCIQYLLKRHTSIDFNATDGNRYTALMLAIQKGIMSVVVELIRFKDRMDRKQIKDAFNLALDSKQDNWDIVAAFETVVEVEKPNHLIKTLKKGNLKTAAQLIKMGGASGVDENGDTILHIVSKLGLLELVPMISEKDPTFTKKNKQNLLPIDVSANEEMRQLLKLEEFKLKQKSPKDKKIKLLDTEEKVQKSCKSTQTTCLRCSQHQQTEENINKSIECQTEVIEEPFKQISFVQYVSQPAVYQVVPSLDDIIKQLSFEINTFAQEVAKYQEDQQPMIDKIIKLVSDVIKNTAPNSRVKVYGSCQTKLFLIDSDIDIVIENWLEEDQVVALYRLQDAMKYQQFIQEVKLIENARFPVLKLICRSEYQHKMIDITISNQFHNGVKCAQAMLEYQKEFKQFKYLALVLKHYFKSINLLNSYQGGLSSYGLMIMLVALLQLKRLKDQEDETVGKVLVDFFELYGMDFDYYGKTISVTLPHSMPTQYVDIPIFFQNIFPQQGYEQQLVICDPLNMHNNVGSSTFKIKQIKIALAIGFSTIYSAKKCKKPCYFRQFDKPVCCILKQLIKNSKHSQITPDKSNGQPFYYLFDQFALQQYLTQN